MRWKIMSYVVVNNTVCIVIHHHNNDKNNRKKTNEIRHGLLLLQVMNRKIMGFYG
ncbi:hypothetical protein HanXRQr2_Chr15g0673381 [Helianthus annuus]|uniref:Uncharacterized protein n=1 Tax=Helianthus annuus TaxID=4232 RepID=A0A9K3DWL0_HELAN|nr:hypothetical protein HanXRQr2_Chr15g0673381 [Helianthus annuus]